MDPIQEQHEKGVGDAFIEWYNRQNSTEFRYHARGVDPPDLIYRFGRHEMLLEITAAYYDVDNATMLWQNARGRPGAADIWMSKNPDQKLIDSINAVLTKKCAKQYPANCILVLNLYPDLTDVEELNSWLPQIKMPVNHPFVGIYLAGIFPMSSSGSLSGYHCWKLA